MQLAEDGQAARPEELEGVPIVILDSLDVTTSDQRQSAQWVVRLPDGHTGLYWAAGKGPMIQVRQWFRDNPRTPLYAWLDRMVNQFGTNVWRITQRDDEGSAAEQGLSSDKQMPF